MDYVDAYKKIMESHTMQTDVINFMDNKLSEIGIDDIELDKKLETIRSTMERIKNLQIDELKGLHTLEILNEAKKNGFNQ